MKKLLIVILLAVGAVQAASIIVPKLKPAKDEYPVNKELLPEVIINGTSTGIRGYSTSFTVEFVKTCPRENPNYNPESNNFTYQSNAEGSIVHVKHCYRCNTGVYSEHVGDSFKSCTYCGDKEPTD